MSPREIHGGYVRLNADGSVEHWDGSICRWQRGWGPFATSACVGDDAIALEEWRAQVGEDQLLLGALAT